MSVEIMEFVRQNICIRDEIKLGPAKSLLHLHIIVAKSVFPRDFITLWEVINPLELVQPLIEIALARASSPKYVPLMRVSKVEIIGLEDRSNEFRIAFEKLIEHFAVVDVVAAARPLGWRRSC